MSPHPHAIVPRGLVGLRGFLSSVNTMGPPRGYSAPSVPSPVRAVCLHAVLPTNMGAERDMAVSHWCCCPGTARYWRKGLGSCWPWPHHHILWHHLRAFPGFRDGAPSLPHWHHPPVWMDLSSSGLGTPSTPETSLLPGSCWKTEAQCSTQRCPGGWRLWIPPLSSCPPTVSLWVTPFLWAHSIPGGHSTLGTPPPSPHCCTGHPNTSFIPPWPLGARIE